MIERVGFDLGEVAHLPAVHAEHRRTPGHDQRHRAQHRAVAPEGEHRVERTAEALGRHRVGRPGLDDGGRDVALGAPHHGVLGQLVRLGPIRMHHDAQVADRGHRTASGAATASSRAASTIGPGLRGVDQELDVAVGAVER